LLVKNLREAAAVAEIAYRGVYAARMTRKQQSDVRKNQVRQGQIFYLRFFLILCIPESIVLVIMGRIFDSDVFLLIMGLFALALLSIVFVSTLYLSARLNVKHAFCTVSSHGIITSREVLPFSAKDGDVGILTKFDDYYVMTFKKIEIFGIKHDDVLIFPNDGVLKNGIEGEDAATVLAGTLGLRSYKVKPTEFVENRELYGDVKPKAAATV
ncbi:MAG: hypothetical protein RRY38_03480, partial [Oscillospiraceae bacterium]